MLHYNIMIRCLVLFFLLLGSPAMAEPLRVVTSFSILADMVRQVGGERVEVVSLVGPNGDAHVFQPTPADARALVSAGLIVVNGLGFEGWVDRLVKASGAKAPVVVATAGIPVQRAEQKHGKHGKHGHGHGHSRHGDDPHAWQDLSHGRIYVANIAEALARAAPVHREAFRQAAEAYSARLAELDRWVRSELGAIPRERRRVITSHESFGYFGRAYGVDFLAPLGLSTDFEPTAKNVASLVRQMRTEEIRVLFVENMSDRRLVQQIAQEADGIVGPALFADALSPPDGPAATYEGMFRHNVTALKAALMP